VRPRCLVSHYPDGMTTIHLAGFPVVIEQAVSWGDMDAFRHVSNLVYFRYFQDARIEYFERLDWMRNPEQFGVGPIVHSTNCRFRRAVTFPDRVLIGARIVEVGADRFTVEHQVFSSKFSAVAAEGRCVIVTFDYARNTKAPLPPELRTRIEAVERSTTESGHGSGGSS
jgi:acyl-CoA thioester hydrolase